MFDYVYTDRAQYTIKMYAKMALFRLVLTGPLSILSFKKDTWAKSVVRLPCLTLIESGLGNIKVYSLLDGGHPQSTLSRGLINRASENRKSDSQSLKIAQISGALRAPSCRFSLRACMHIKGI